MNDAETRVLQRRIDNRRQIMRAGITSWHAVLTDEYIDQMAERFTRLRIGPLTRATFDQYMEAPECCEMYAEALRNGGAAQFDEQTPGTVVLIH